MTPRQKLSEKAMELKERIVYAALHNALNPTHLEAWIEAAITEAVQSRVNEMFDEKTAWTKALVERHREAARREAIEECAKVVEEQKVLHRNLLPIAGWNRCCAVIVEAIRALTAKKTSEGVTGRKRRVDGSSIDSYLNDNLWVFCIFLSRSLCSF